MKKNLYRCAGIFCAVFVSLCLLPLNGSAAGENVPSLKKGSVLLDVRTVSEFRSGHLRSAVNIPLDRLGKEIRGKIKNPKTPVYLYCRSGRRSANAVKILKKMNYKELYDLGGMKEASKKLSLPVVK